jgi:uncharacterized protein YecT (DUF1311 family)
MRACTLMIVLASALPFAAQSAPDCANAVTQADMNWCASLDLDHATDLINATYNDVRRRLPETKANALRDVQRAWIRFKDLHCELEASQVEGGSMQPLVRDVCLTTMTEQREADLKKLGEMLID